MEARGTLAVVVCLLCLGCGEKKPEEPKLFPVKGKVTLDNVAIAGASVAFLPTEPGQGTRASGGRTNEAGIYELETNGKAGIPAGKFKVVITKRVMPDGSPPDDVKTPPILSKASETIPPAYSDRNLTTLKATVPEGGGTIDFALKKSGR